MINQQLLRRIQKKNPDYSLDKISLVIDNYIANINKKIANCQTINLVVPKLGRIHTHGNSKNKAMAKRIEKNNIKINENFKYSDKQLLF